MNLVSTILLNLSPVVSGFMKQVAPVDMSATIVDLGRINHTLDTELDMRPAAMFEQWLRPTDLLIDSSVRQLESRRIAADPPGDDVAFFERFVRYIERRMYHNTGEGERCPPTIEITPGHMVTMKPQAVYFFGQRFKTNKVAQKALRMAAARAVVLVATMGLTLTVAQDLYAYSLFGRALCTPSQTEYCIHCGLETKRYNLPRATCCATARAALKRGKCTGLLPPLAHQLYPCAQDCLTMMEQHGALSILHYVLAHSDNEGLVFLQYFSFTPERLVFLKNNCGLDDVTIDRFIHLQSEIARATELTTRCAFTGENPLYQGDNSILDQRPKVSRLRDPLHTQEVFWVNATAPIPARRGKINMSLTVIHHRTCTAFTLSFEDQRSEKLCRQLQVIHKLALITDAQWGALKRLPFPAFRCALKHSSTRDMCIVTEEVGLTLLNLINIDHTVSHCGIAQLMLDLEEGLQALLSDGGVVKGICISQVHITTDEVAQRAVLLCEDLGTIEDENQTFRERYGELKPLTVLSSEEDCNVMMTSQMRGLNW
jgi:hypothetical protein